MLLQNLKLSNKYVALNFSYSMVTANIEIHSTSVRHWKKVNQFRIVNYLNWNVLQNFIILKFKGLLSSAVQYIYMRFKIIKHEIYSMPLLSNSLDHSLYTWEKSSTLTCHSTCLLLFLVVTCSVSNFCVASQRTVIESFDGAVH